MEYSINEIADILGVSCHSSSPARLSILLTDSRSLLRPAETLFFALRTSSGNGHAFIPALYAKGVRGFVVESGYEVPPGLEDAAIIRVGSPLDALHAIGSECRRRFEMPVIAITGSRGKTTVKEWIYSLLRDDFSIVRSPRSFNSQIGVPLSLWQLDPSCHNLAIIEAGISRPGEMERLESIIRPEIGVFTNIGGVHSEGFASIEEKCHEKASLLKNCKSVVFCADNPLISSSIPEGPERVGWSRSNPDAPLFISSVEKTAGVMSVRYSWKPGGFTGTFTMSCTSDIDLENALNSLAVMLLLGAGPEAVAERMPGLKPVDTRLEVIEGLNGCMLVEDTYTADLTSLAQALDFTCRRDAPGLVKTVILGSLGEDSSADRSALYSSVASLLDSRGVERMIGIGEEIAAHAEAFQADSKFYRSVGDFMKSALPTDFSSELILLKGSGAGDFSPIVEMLEARQHGTVLEINLDAVVDNFNYFRSHIRPTTGMCCMIKASGYGAGSHELARTLQTQGASYLAVAVHDEGADLRKAGITMPIIVLNPAVENFKALFDNRLEPEIYSIDFLRRLIDEAGRYGVKDYPVHIKIDSGMHRLGFLLETLPEVIELLRSTDAVVPRSIFTHLCAADDPMEDDYTRSQFEYFDRCCEMFLPAFPGKKILRHALNSTGIIRFPDHQLDMVRLGIGLYGVRTMQDGSQDGLRPVSALHTIIISLKEWPEGTTIGYNRRGRLTRRSVIATVPVGYADGLNRHLGYGNARFRIRGVLCPTVGSICMDACMIDVTDVPGVAVGDRVEIFGETISVETLADTLGTIPYEVLTSVSDRVKRVYYRE